MKNKSIASLSLRKLLLSVLVTAPLATLPAQLWALPASQTALNGIITPSSGVSVTWTNANRIDVQSTATNSVIKWTDFGGGVNTINSGDLINYALPSASSSILNMVTGSNATLINGTLQSNGNIYVMNANGITIGATGVITAAGVGLSTVPETDYYFLTNGTLSYVPNQSPSSTTTSNVIVSPGATITAASGTGNVWIVGNGIGLAGTIDGGNVSVTGQGGGNVILGYLGDLVVGDVANKSANLTVTQSGTGQIAIGATTENTTVYGPSVSLTTGNQTISQFGTGLFKIGGGASNATVTTNSGTANTTLSNIAVNGASNTLTVNATGASISVTAPTGNLAVGATASGTLAATTSAGNLALNASSVNGAVTATAVGGNITSGGAVLGNSTVTLLVDSGKNVTFAGKATGFTVDANISGQNLGNVSLTATAGSIAIPTINAANLAVTASAGNITQAAGAHVTNGNVTLNASGNVTLSQAIWANNVSVTAGKNIVQNVGMSITDPATQGGDDVVNSVSFTSTGGTITLDALTATTVSANATGNVTLGGAISATTLNATSGGVLAFNNTVGVTTLNATSTGNITQSAAITVSGNTSITGNAAVTLTNAGNDFATVILTNAPSGVSITDKNGIVIGNGTNVAGNATITASAVGGAAGDVVFGSAGTDAIAFAKTLTVNNTGVANGNITDATNNLTVSGNVSLTVAGTGVITLDGATGNGVGLNSSYGQVSATTAGGKVTLFENTVLNLGAINTGGGNLLAYSAQGITNTGKLTVANVTVGAGSYAAPGDISLAFNDTSSTPSTNAISGTITLLDDLHLLNSGSAITGNYLAKSLTVVNGVTNAALISIPANVYTTGTTANINVTSVGAAVDLGLGALVTSGTVTLTSGGAITATNGANTFTNVTVNAAGAVAVSSTKDLTVNSTGITGSGTVSFTSAGNLTIGNYVSATSGDTSFTATGNAITDSAPNIQIQGAAAFTGSSISVTKAGHSFGGVSLTTTGNGTATFVESGTLNLKSVSTGTGAVSLTSTNGSVVQNASTAGIVTTGAVTVSAVNGGVNLSDAANNSLGSTVTLTAKTDSAIKNKVSTSLGNITVGSGNLTVDLSGTANTNVTQATGSKIYAYGATAFKTAGTGTINVSNSGNQFGGITIATAGGNATIKESTTLNLASVATSGGTLTVTSENGSIIDSGTVTSTGVTVFSAPNGNISLVKTASNYGTVSFTTGGNVAITDGGGNLVLDASTIGGTLDVTNTTGNITQLGALSVAGNASFTASASASQLYLTNTGNSFGAVKFKTGTGGTIIDETPTFVLLAGSSSTGPVTINTLGNFVTAGTGGSSFSSNLSIYATGTIIPTAGSLSVRGTLLVNSNNTKDLSALFLTGDLFGNNPTNQGTGAYSGPQTP